MSHDCKDCRRHVIVEVPELRVSGEVLVETPVCTFRHTGRITCTVMRADERLCGPEAKHFLLEDRLQDA